MPGLALSGGYVYRTIDNFRVRGQLEPSVRRLQRAGHDPRSRARWRAGQRRRRHGIPGFNLNPAALALPVGNITTNLPGSGEYHTVEFQANKRQAGRWSLSAVVLEAVEQGPRDRLLRPEPAIGHHAFDAERPDQHQRRPLRLHDVDGEDQRQLRRAVRHPHHAGPAFPAGPALRPHVPGRRRQRHQLRHAAHPGRADRLAPAGQHRHPRRARWRSSSTSRRAAASACSSMSTTSPTPMPRRTSPGTAGRPSSSRSASSARRSCASA